MLRKCSSSAKRMSRLMDGCKSSRRRSLPRQYNLFLRVRRMCWVFLWSKDTGDVLWSLFFFSFSFLPYFALYSMAFGLPLLFVYDF
ncbi:hypothetical protein BCR39DRAFT_518477 [Naematelia encephala]|uniref:Transmembrane protein n=1 Tax=Naematelia encephala TaxID=71784 RepID=A0A1Y2BHP5_9TREE|nr:hypothetical protein BCR39DRAFT_518477 [Naematelia encephala]